MVSKFKMLSTKSLIVTVLLATSCANDDSAITTIDHQNEISNDLKTRNRSKDKLSWGIQKMGYQNVENDPNYSGKKIWIIDSGIAKIDALNINEDLSRNFVPDSNGKIDDKAWTDQRGHGTSVAAVAAAKDLGNGYTGVAAGAEVVAIKILNKRGNIAPILRDALAYVNDNIKPGDVWNMSLGSVRPLKAMGSEDLENWKEIQILLKKLEEKAPGTIAAGNYTIPLDESPHPESYFSDNHDQIYIVGAVNENEKVLGAFGKVIDFFAPGYNLPILTNKGVLDNDNDSDNQGTSLAAPHIAGLLFIGHYDTSHSIKEQEFRAGLKQESRPIPVILNTRK